MRDTSNTTTSCWTCRRRRVKCDRQLPQCQKCFVSGEQCQGYSLTKPLRWTNGVASRGKLMGKSLPIDDGVNPPIPKLFLDPVVQDLSPATRHYIRYFDQFCSVESVLDRSRQSNPFREFMRLIPASPALLNTIISIAALHQARRQLDDYSPKLEDLSPEPCSRVTTSGYSPVIIDALKHKQLALKNIRNELLNTDPENMVGTIASMLLLVWQDLMDSGTDSWKHHLDALKGIVPTGLLSPKSQNKPQRTASPTLYNSFEVTYAAYQILGTTFVRNKDIYEPLFSTFPILQMMQLCDGQSWAGCPAELLYIIFLVNNISRSQSLPAQLETHIICLYEEFSPMKWAIANQVPRLMKPRFHLASAYKGAVGIYMSQVMNGLQAGHSLESLPMSSIDTLIFHLQSIAPSDDHFKSLVWPTFIIGAEAQQISHRAVIDEVFEHLGSIWRCENVRNASIVLRYLWAQNDRREYTGNWINELYGWGMDWIFI